MNRSARTPFLAQRGGLGGVIALIFIAIASFACGVANAEDVHIAAASNFKPTLEQLAHIFERESGHDVQISAGSTGLLYSQIINGAPFDLYLAADEARPALIFGHGLSTGAPVTYALGRLVVWTSSGKPDPKTALKNQSFRRLAIANPKLAPYGRAAFETLQNMGIEDSVSDRLVFGENIGQTFAFIYMGHADLGFIARAQILSLPIAKRGQFWAVPPGSHAPIRQDMVLLKRADNNAAARSFYQYLQSDTAKALIAERGYDLPETDQP